MDTHRTPDLKTISSDLVNQLSKLAPLMFAVYIPLILLLAALVVIYLVTDIPLRRFFIDPVAEFNSPMYIGCVSNFGVLCWGAASAVCLFGGWLAFQSKTHPEIAWFLVCAGAISGILMLDDLFLLHEEVFEDHFYIPQKVRLRSLRCDGVDAADPVPRDDLQFRLPVTDAGLWFFCPFGRSRPAGGAGRVHNFRRLSRSAHHRGRVQIVWHCNLGRLSDSHFDAKSGTVDTDSVNQDSCCQPFTPSNRTSRHCISGGNREFGVRNSCTSIFIATCAGC